MKELLKYVPGFRSNTNWKKVIATIYYIIGLTAIFDSIWTFITVITFPFLIFSFVGLIKRRKNLKSTPKILLPFIASLLIFSLAGNLIPPATVESEKQSLVSEQKEEPKLEQENLKLEEAKKEKERLEEEAQKLEEERIEKEKIEEERINAEENAKKEEIALAEQLKKEEATKLAIPAPSEATGSSSGGGSSTGPATQTGQDEVYITPTGTKYHSRACGKGNYSATTLENAKSKGLTPCKKCY